jgi:hypothetical protein
VEQGGFLPDKGISTQKLYYYYKFSNIPLCMLGSHTAKDGSGTDGGDTLAAYFYDKTKSSCTFRQAQMYGSTTLASYWYAAGIGDIPANYMKYTINLSNATDTYVSGINASASSGYFTHYLSSDGITSLDSPAQFIMASSVEDTNNHHLSGYIPKYISSYNNSPETLNSSSDILLPESQTVISFTGGGWTWKTTIDYHLNIISIENNVIKYSYYSFEHVWNGGGADSRGYRYNGKPGTSEYQRYSSVDTFHLEFLN